MRVTSLFENLAIRNIRWAGRFAGQTADAILRVGHCPRIGGELAFGFFTPQAQATARRIVFVARQLISRADFQTEPAMDAAREQVPLAS